VYKEEANSNNQQTTTGEQDGHTTSRPVVPMLLLSTSHPPLCQLYMGQFGSSSSGVVLAGLGELLGDDQLRDVHSVTQQVRDGLLSMQQRPLGIPGGRLGGWMGGYVK